MFGQIAKVGRTLKFVGSAKHLRNVEGPVNREMVHFVDHFTDDTLSTDKWTATTNGTSAAIAVNHATYPHVCRITTGTADGNAQFLASALCWEDDQNAICEARILLADVSGTCLYFGFSDAISETSPNMPIDYDGGTLAAAATNAVGIVVDADDSVNGVSSIVGVGVNNTALETAVDSGTDWADDEWHRLRVELNSDGDASFYLDEKLFGFMETAIVSGTKLCIMVALTNRETAQNYGYVDYVKGWQDESA